MQADADVADLVGLDILDQRNHLRYESPPADVLDRFNSAYRSERQQRGL